MIEVAALTISTPSRQEKVVMVKATLRNLPESWKQMTSGSLILEEMACMLGT